MALSSSNVNSSCLFVGRLDLRLAIIENSDFGFGYGSSSSINTMNEEEQDEEVHGTRNMLPVFNPILSFPIVVCITSDKLGDELLFRIALV
jgi:Mg2+/citrate symporter